MDEQSAAKISKGEVTQRAIERARDDDFFLGWALAHFQVDNRMEDEKLAEWLGCTREQLWKLSLCRLPSDQSDDFAVNVQQIATFGGCRPDRLVQLLREVAALSSLREGAKLADGALMAARDRQGNRTRPEDGG